MEEKVLELSEGFEKESHTAENYQFTIIGKIGYLWAVYGATNPGSQTILVCKGIR